MKAGLTRAKVAAGMGIGMPYLCDLEAGRRNWTVERFEAAKRVIEGNVEGVSL